MSNQQGDKQNEKKPVSTTRIVLWIAVAAVAIYSIATGVIGLIQHGS